MRTDSGKCAFINKVGTVTIGSGDASAYNVVLGNFQGDSGSLVVDDAVLDVGPYDPDCGGPIYVGGQGTGSLTITDGGTVNARYLYIGASTNLSLPNGSGSVGLDGSGNSLVINPGECSGAGICIGCDADFNDGGIGVLDIKDGTVEVDNLGFSRTQRDKHLYICGGTGTGESKFLENLTRQDIRNWSKSKCGLLVIDPHGNLYDKPHQLGLVGFRTVNHSD